MKNIIPLKFSYSLPYFCVCSYVSVGKEINQNYKENIYAQKKKKKTNDKMAITYHTLSFSSHK